jgi:hypothetical protein
MKAQRGRGKPLWRAGIAEKKDFEMRFFGRRRAARLS